MINKIFFDLDECLLHTAINAGPNADGFLHYNKENPKLEMRTIFNPKAHDALEFARSLVGNENVYVLTSSVRWYAERLCAEGKFGFTNDQIFTREDLQNRKCAGAYGGASKLADVNNVLIDNLPPRYNEEKLVFTGIRDWQNRYIQVRDYYGADSDDSYFLREITEKLNRLINMNTIFVAKVYESLETQNNPGRNVGWAETFAECEQMLQHFGDECRWQYAIIEEVSSGMHGMIRNAWWFEYNTTWIEIPIRPNRFMRRTNHTIG